MKHPKDTLFLVLSGKWFRMIENGEKTEEYRAITPYWERRIWEKRDELRKIIFQLGYGKNAPRMEFEIDVNLENKTHPNRIFHIAPYIGTAPRWRLILNEAWGYDRHKGVFVICIGKRLDKGGQDAWN